MINEHPSKQQINCKVLSMHYRWNR